MQTHFSDLIQTMHVSVTQYFNLEYLDKEKSGSLSTYEQQQQQQIH